MGFKEKLEEKKNLVNDIVASFLPETKGMAALIFEAMSYSVLNGGKRLRPMMMMESYRALGGSSEDESGMLYPFMAALEFIHSYSLVHDDLPEMDNDMYRRGKLTTHAKYGADMGVLAGDALLNYAYETAGKAVGYAALSGDINKCTAVAKALAVLAEKAGAFGMVGGQTVDVKKTGQAVNDEEIDFIYSLKTGALLEASLMIGALLAGASDEVVEKICTAGHKVGMAFQIKDDILDETSTNEVLGKPVHSDEENNKTTYVTLHGLEESQLEVDRLTKEAEEILDEILPGDVFLKELLLALVVRDR